MNVRGATMREILDVGYVRLLDFWEDESGVDGGGGSSSSSSSSGVVVGSSELRVEGAVV